jgi:peptide/nickel transport system substrate-binding protein
MKKIYLFLVTMVFALAFVACTDDQTTTVEQTTTEATTTAEGTTTEAPTTEPVPIYEERVVNDDYTLIIQSSTMDGVFNPFFSSSAYDNQVIGLVNVALLGLDETGAVVASDYYPSVAQSYSIFYTDDLTGYTAKDEYEEGDYVVYDIVIKNGALFSDGNEIDAEDVLFNYYTYLDPSYNGSSTLYTLPILGLQDFRTQVAGSDAIAAKATMILADDGRVNGYVATEDYTEAEFDAYWAAFATAGEAYAQEIVDYAKARYATYYDAYAVPFGFPTQEEFATNVGAQVAWGMFFWGYGDGITDGVTNGASGTAYTVAELTSATYFAEILAANTGEDGFLDYAGGYQELSNYESAGGDFVASAAEGFVSGYATGEGVPTIAGLVQGTTTIDGEEFDTVKIILTEQNPKAILSLGVTVAPQHYYTAGWTPTVDAIVNYGVEFNNPLFMEHLASYNSAPMGAGSHKFVEVEADETVTFVRNDNFETMGGENVYNSNINKIALKIVQSGAEYSALEADDVHYATVSATADVMESIALTDDLVAVLVDNLGYGYICINPQVYPNLNERIALTTVFDMSKVLDYYPNGLADLITRSMSQVSWAYPENADYIYPYDETLASAISYLEAAGYTFDDTLGTIGEFTDTPTYQFFLPSGSDSHPAGGVYIKAQELLATIGVTVEIVVDTNLIANIKTTPTGVYALAWGSALDPDMYQVNHYESQANSVISNGIVWLHDNGNDNDLGTMDIVKLDGTTVTMNQAEALEYLAELIELGVKYMLPEERAPIYAKALEVLAQLNIEIPTYQRKNLFVYNGDVIDQTTVSTTVTPYWGPLAEIWKVSFVEGTTGNETVQVLVGYEGQN